MEKKLENGTEVLVFSYKSKNKIDTNFIKGKIISCLESNDGNKSVIKLYVVLGEDSQRYVASYGIATYTDYYIRTSQEEIERLNNMIKDNHVHMNRITKDNILCYQALKKIISSGVSMDAKPKKLIR